MSNLFNDPLGLKLMKCNKPKKEEPVPENEAEETASDSHYYYPYNGYSSAFQPSYHQIAPPPMPVIQQQFIVYQQQPYYYAAPQHYHHPVVIQNPAPAAHQCVSCNSNSKCKECKKEEEKSKKYVVKPNFWNPRS